MDKNTQQSPRWLVIVRDISAIIAAIVIPVTLAISGNHINSTIKDKEIRLQYVGIAVDILKSKPTDETKALRDWSILVIQEYSTIPFSTNAINELQSNPLPKASLLLDVDGNKILDVDGNQIYMSN
jgi:hypothetical protein